ncbi:MAG: hypothetical protein HYU71_06365 [Bacteroidetes bacterium]|nr:hypothetical protein [Bacteroidota bacterium]
MSLIARYKKYGFGSSMTPDQMQAATTAGATAGLVGQVAEAAFPPNRYGRTATAGNVLGDAGKFGAMGAQVAGPWGAVAGAGIGLVTGLFRSGAQKKAEQEAKMHESWAMQQNDQANAAARIGADPSLVKGNLAAGYYAAGGELKDSTTVKVPKIDMAEELRAINAGKTGFTAAQRDSIASTFNKDAYAQHKNGSATPLSSTAIQFNGPSHENGGIQIPGKNAEVEGGETSTGDYVFSERLGFAQLHKPIARAIGKLEQKPASPERINSLKLLKGEEGKLKVLQEYTKQRLGLN